MQLGVTCISHFIVNTIQFSINLHLERAYERQRKRERGGRGSADESVQDPESQEGACESLKGPIVLVKDVLF
jgi:hypothetical protein